MNMTGNEWAGHDQFSESTCFCRCGAVFRSHSRYSMVKGLISRKPCPTCGETTTLVKASSDPEHMTIEGKRET